ncbi:hypothetical protein CPB85DRAFT_543504 [Mucidula mucida]|nr:hypothetical protein CPB85DRAFT_543504 [Mucidula mucida]
MSILECSVGLAELTMKIGMVYVNVALDHIVSLPMLRHIDITEYEASPGALADFLHHLRFPSIQHLALTFPEHFIDLRYLHWHPHLCRLTTLQIECSMDLVPGEGDEGYAQLEYIGGTKMLLKFLALMTGVECFQLKDKISTEFLDGLVAKAGVKGTTLFPLLRTLNLRECTFVNDAEVRRSLLRIAEIRGDRTCVEVSLKVSFCFVADLSLTDSSLCRT